MGEHKGMERRAFLKTAALSSIALGASAALAGCSPSAGGDTKASNAEVSWDKEVDVLVLGSGTGCFAALAAAAKGAGSVCVVEKSPMWGGTAATSGGGLAVPLTYAAAEAGVTDSKEEIVKYITNASDHRADQDVLSAYIDNGSDFIDWLSAEMEWKFVASPLFGDYYEPMEGWIPMGRGELGATNAEGPLIAGQMWEQMKAKLEGYGVELLMDTEATELITNDEGGVIGAVCGGKNIKAGSVIVATGGFDHNDEMRAKYLPYKALWQRAPCPPIRAMVSAWAWISAPAFLSWTVGGAPRASLPPATTPKSLLTKAALPMKSPDATGLCTEVCLVPWSSTRRAAVSAMKQARMTCSIKHSHTTTPANRVTSTSRPISSATQPAGTPTQCPAIS